LKENLELAQFTPPLGHLDPFTSGIDTGRCFFRVSILYIYNARSDILRDTLINVFDYHLISPVNQKPQYMYKNNSSLVETVGMEFVDR